MGIVTLVEFRRNAQTILRRIHQGQSIILTSRGRPVARLEKVEERGAEGDDPIYHLHEAASEKGRSMTNVQIDRVLYGL